MGTCVTNHVWAVASNDEVDRAIAFDPCACIYGMAEPLRKSSSALISHQGLLAIISPYQEMYPDLPSVLQLYPLLDQPEVRLVNLDQIPNLPKPLLVCTTSLLGIQSSHYKIKPSQKYQRFKLSSFQTEFSSKLDIRLAGKQDHAKVLALYQESKALRFHPKFLDWGPFSICSDKSGQCIGAYGTHVYPQTKVACLLGHLYISEKWRNCGIATALVAHLSSTLIKHYNQLLCDIEPNNFASIRIHRRLCYLPTNTLIQLSFCS